MASPARKVLQAHQEDNIPKDVATGPPKPSRTAFMCFSDAKSKEIAAKQHTKKNFKKERIKHVAAQWKILSNRERAYWDEEARLDKRRYITEKSAYKGPWNIPKRRAKKHPLAPKRPMSAFLKYSQTRRAIVKQDNPDMNNTDVSRLLGEMWRGHSEKERSPYKEEEERERAVYKRNVAEFRARQARLDAASRIPHSSIPTENVRRPSNHVDTVAPYQQQQHHHRHSHHQPPAAAAVEPINAGYRQEQAYHQGSIHRHDNASVYHHRHPSNSIHRQGSNAHHPYDAHFGYSFPQAPSFDSFVDAIPESHMAHHLSNHDALFDNSGRQDTDENRYPQSRGHRYA